MNAKGWAVTMGLGVAAGAVAAMMLPKQSAAHKVVRKAACAVEDAAMNAKDKLTNKLDMMIE